VWGHFLGGCFVEVHKRAGSGLTEELVMSLIGALVGYALTAFILVLIARMLLDWGGVVARGPEWAGRARSFTHAWTEPVLAPVRRRVPPVRAGGIGIDLAFTVVFVAALILRSVAFSL
jgi:YggT family protein